MEDVNEPVEPRIETTEAQDAPVEDAPQPVAAAEPPAAAGEAFRTVDATPDADEDDETVTEEATVAGEEAALAVFAGVGEPDVTVESVERVEGVEAVEAVEAVESVESVEAVAAERAEEPPAETQATPASETVQETAAAETPVDEPVQSEALADEGTTTNDGAVAADALAEPEAAIDAASATCDPSESPTLDPLEGEGAASFGAGTWVVGERVWAESPLTLTLSLRGSEDQSDVCAEETFSPGADSAGADADVAPAPEDADAEAAPVVEAEAAELIVEATEEQASAPAPDAAAEPAEEVLPWRAGAPDDAAETTIPDDAVEPQPPAVAFAPAFLAVDEAGRPVADEAVEAIEQALNRPIPALAPVKLEPAGVETEAEIEAAAWRNPNGGALWTIPLICLGIAIIACCLLIPQADENRQLVWEREKLRRDLEQIQKQVDLNDRFLQAMADDAVLTQRLVQRQMNVVRAGTAVLELDANSRDSFTSPFQLVTVAPPAPMPEYVAYGGRFAALCRHPKTQLYMMGTALLLIATGLVLGRDTPTRRVDDAEL